MHKKRHENNLLVNDLVSYTCVRESESACASVYPKASLEDKGKRELFKPAESASHFQIESPEP